MSLYYPGWPLLPLVEMTFIILAASVAMYFACFLLQLISVWVGVQICSRPSFVDQLRHWNSRRQNHTRLSRKERNLDSNQAETQAILQAREVLKTLPDPPSALVRQKIERLVEEQRRILAELDKPSVFMLSVNSIRDNFEAQLLEVRRELLFLDPKRVDYSYYLRKDGEVSE